MRVRLLMFCRSAVLVWVGLGGLIGCFEFDAAYLKCRTEGRCLTDAGGPDAEHGGRDAGHDGGSGDADAGTDGGCVPAPIATTCADAWCEVYSTPHGQRLDAVHGFSATDVWIAGSSGYVAHWDGCGWTEYTLNDDPHIDDIFGSDPGAVWFVGSKSVGGTSYVVVRRSHPSGLFTHHEPPVRGRLTAASGSGADSIWMVGVGGTPTAVESRALYWNGQEIVEVGRTELPAMDQSLKDVTTSQNGDVWIVAGNQSVWRRRDGLWRTFSAPGPLIGVWAPADEQLWGVGTGGTIAKLDTTQDAGTFLEIAPVTFEHLYAVHGFSPTRAWAVGVGSAIAEYEEVSWNATQVLPDTVFTDVWAGSETEVWIVSDRGKVLHNRR